MGDYGMRGAAAQRLAKKGKKDAPPEDDLGLPPEEGSDAPAPEGGAPDLASLLGAAGGGAPPPGGDMMPPDAGMPPQGPDEEMAEGQPQDLDTALGGVENALDGLPPEAADEIRVHLNAIKEIAAKAGKTPEMEAKGEPTANPEAGSAAPMPPGPMKEEMAS